MKLLLINILIGLTVVVQAQKKPDWANARPVDPMSYTGIGMASKSDPDYMQQAKQKALTDLLSEIKVEISTESVLQMAEKDDEVSSFFKQQINTQSHETLEQFELTDSWSDDKEYWVYYRLSKAEYQHIIAQRKAKVTREAYSFWQQGNNALNEGNIYTAIDCFIKGMDCVESFANEELIYDPAGVNVNIALELYASLSCIFNDVAITPASATLNLKELQATKQPFVFTVQRKGTPLKNIKLKTAFTSGSGSLSSANSTGSDGTGELYIQSVTSKNRMQEVQITTDMQPFYQYKHVVYEKALRVFAGNPPRCILKLEVEPENITAFIKTIGTPDASLDRSVKSLLSRNHFDIVTSEAKANLLVYLNSSIRKGNTIKGDMYDMVEYFSNIQIQIIERESGKARLVYTLTDFRTLAPVSSTEQTARNSAAKEAMRKLERELKKELETTFINNN